MTVHDAPSNTGRISFADWYQDRFHSDPAHALEHFTADLNSLAADFGIDFNGTLSSIYLSTREQKLANKADGLKFTDKKANGRSALWARIDLEDDEYGNKLKYPFITFNTKRHGGRHEVWNGRSALWDMYRRECNIRISKKEQADRNRKMAEKAKQREAKAEQVRRKQEAEAKAKAESVARDLAAWDTLSAPATDYRHTYLARKKIAGAAMKATPIRCGEDKHGRFVALMLHNIHGQRRGLQRIYETKIQTSPGADPTDKTFTWGMDMKGAHLIIGDIKTALEAGDPIGFAEGYATAASWFLATGQVTVVTLNSGNLKEVVAQYQAWYPDADKVIAADNDCWKCAEGKGNAGLMAALELTKRFPSIKAYYPNFKAIPDEMDLNSQPTDWNDVHLVHQNGIAGISSLLRRKINRLEASRKPWEFSLQKLAYSSQFSAEKAAKHALMCGLGLAPLLLSSREVYQTVLETLSPGIDQRELTEKLWSFTDWNARKRIKQAARLRGFTHEKLSGQHINYIRVQGTRKGNGQLLLPGRVLKMLRTMNGPIIVRAPMASGKTQRLIKPLLQSSPQAAYIAHRVSLVGNACNMLSDEQRGILVRNYQHLTPDLMPFVAHLGVCINSAPYAKFRPFLMNCQDLFIDEAKQTLAHITDGTIDNPKAAFEFLAELMNTVNRVVFCDADANDALIEFCELACPGQTIHVIEMAADCSDFKVEHTSADMVHQSIIEAARAGEKVLVATDGAQAGERLALDIRAQVSGCRVLNVMAETRGDKEVEQFQNCPNEESFHYDVVIYSPAISSGVSIENNYFTRHYGIFYGQVTPTDAVQMLRRDRFARRLVVGFRDNSIRKEDDRERIVLGKVLADQLAAGEGADSGRWQLNAFDLCWAAFAANERASRNEFANNMLLMLIADGYQVSRAERNPIMEEQAQYSKKAARERQLAERIERVESNTTPDEEEYNRLRMRDILSRDDAARMTRYMIETELCADVSAETILFMDDRGLSRVKRMERALAGYDEAHEYTNKQAEKGVTLVRRDNAAAAWKIWNTVLEHTGLNLATGEGEFNAQQAREALQAALPDGNAIAMYNELNIGPYVHPQASNTDATKWVAGILERMGLTLCLRKVGRRKERRHTLDQNQWQAMISYVNRRAKRGVSSLKITMNDTEVTATATIDNAPKATQYGGCKDTGMGGVGGGAGCLDMYINNTGVPAPHADEFIPGDISMVKMEPIRFASESVPSDMFDYRLKEALQAAGVTLHEAVEVLGDTMLALLNSEQVSYSTLQEVCWMIRNRAVRAIA